MTETGGDCPSSQNPCLILFWTELLPWDGEQALWKMMRKNVNKRGGEGGRNKEWHRTEGLHMSLGFCGEGRL